MNVSDLLKLLGGGGGSFRGAVESSGQGNEFPDEPPSGFTPPAGDNAFSELLRQSMLDDEFNPQSEASDPTYEELHEKNQQSRDSKLSSDRGSRKFSYEGDMAVPFPDQAKGSFSRVKNFDSRSANYRDPTELEIDKLLGYITRGEGYADKHMEKIQNLLGIEQLKHAHSQAGRPDLSQMKEMLGIQKTAQDIQNDSPEARSENEAKDFIQELIKSNGISPDAASGLLTLRNKRGLTYRELVNIISRSGLASRDGRRDTGDKLYKRLSVGMGNG